MGLRLDHSEGVESSRSAKLVDRKLRCLKLQNCRTLVTLGRTIVELQSMALDKTYMRRLSSHDSMALSMWRALYESVLGRSPLAAGYRAPFSAQLTVNFTYPP